MKKADYLFRFVALVLIVTLVIQLIPIECYATGMISADDTVETVLAESDSETAKMSDENKQLTDVSALREEPMILSEVTDLREEKVKHFFNHDGSFSAVSYLDPVHFELNGKYEDIDNTLMSSVKQIENRKESGYIPKQSPVDVFFMDSAVNEDLVYLTDRGYQISWTYLPEEN